ncbi:hypothetical protein NDU88_005601 [Pleurodeles waltl]|uniref:Uncharacterized protein n=1 Tax=Pleurodeles waltl TaxID=8319 RepID=A0AAV7RJ14_PLEWA|nr:hypothetical protein NDU88_005601 [Pleurodeles waltl]
MVFGSDSEESDRTPRGGGTRGPHYKGEPCIWSGGRPAEICGAARSAGTRRLASGKPAARWEGRRGQRSVERAPRDKEKKKQEIEEATWDTVRSRQRPFTSPGRRRPCMLALRSQERGTQLWKLLPRQGITMHQGVRGRHITADAFLVYEGLAFVKSGCVIRILEADSTNAPDAPMLNK